MLNRLNRSILNKSLGGIYLGTFTLGAMEGFKYSMKEWEGIEEKNIKLSKTGIVFQYLHTGILTSSYGLMYCMGLTLSPILIPSIFILDKIKY